ncbi:unnamed protein product [Amoebophrya sp. A25]|nr:unnamed protein product [Amoebophrya sp. A25]|eukprot:GSA25T00018741001.1
MAAPSTIVDASGKGTAIKLFCRSARQRLLSHANAASGPKSRLLFVVGNTSCDLDSVCSAIGFAYHLQSEQQKRSGEGGLGSQEDTTTHVIPLLNYQRRAFPQLLQQAYWLEKYFGLSLHDLSFFPEDVQDILSVSSEHETTTVCCGSESVSPSTNSTVFHLVDHNEVDPGQRAFLRGRIVGCLDHHEDAGASFRELLARPDGTNSDVEIHAPSLCGPEKIVGSCASLVLSRLLTRTASASAKKGFTPTAENGAQALEDEGEVFRLLAGAILCDTRNFADATKGSKWSVIGDQEVFDQALERYASQAKNLDRSGICQDLFEIKFDLERNLALGFPALLAGDYKQFQYCSTATQTTVKIGFATLPIQLPAVLDKWAVGLLCDDMKAFCASRSTHALVILSSDKDMVKHCGLYSTAASTEGQDEAKGAVVDIAMLATGLKTEMGLEEIAITPGEPASRLFAVYRQQRTEKSRKQVEPLMKALLTA